MPKRNSKADRRRRREGALDRLETSTPNNQVDDDNPAHQKRIAQEIATLLEKIPSY